MIQRSYYEPIIKRLNEPNGKDEVDFVLVKDTKVVAIEVKSNHEKDTSGLHTFQDMFHPHRLVLVGEEGIPLETFLKSDLKELFA